MAQYQYRYAEIFEEFENIRTIITTIDNEKDLIYYLATEEPMFKYRIIGKEIYNDNKGSIKIEEKEPKRRRLN